MRLCFVYRRIQFIVVIEQQHVGMTIPWSPKAGTRMSSPANARVQRQPAKTRASDQDRSSTATDQSGRALHRVLTRLLESSAPSASCTMNHSEYEDFVVRNLVDESRGPDQQLADRFVCKLWDDLPCFSEFGQRACSILDLLNESGRVAL